MLLFAGCQIASALSFKFTYDSSIPYDKLSIIKYNMEAAAESWTDILSDEITLNIKVTWSSALNYGEAARASILYLPVTYVEVKEAMEADASTAVDQSAIATLQAENVRMLINRTSDNPAGPGSATPYLDEAGDNNRRIRISLSNAKALGLFPAEADFIDSTISISSRPSWDFNQADGITPGQSDFQSAMTHELGHSMGIATLVEAQLAGAPGKRADRYTYLSPMDLFRYSEESANQNAIDWTADGRRKFFSINGGITALADFATGRYGDYADPSHWHHNRTNPFGIMDPTVTPLGKISQADQMLLDVIGYDLRPQPIEEPEPVEEPEPEPKNEGSTKTDDPSDEEPIEAEPAEPVIPTVLAKPTLRRVSFERNQMEVEWDPVEGARGYLVYTCDEINGGFRIDTGGYFNGTTWIKRNASHGAKCFIQIRAF